MDMQAFWMRRQEELFPELYLFFFAALLGLIFGLSFRSAFTYEVTAALRGELSVRFSSASPSILLFLLHYLLPVALLFLFSRSLCGREFCCILYFVRTLVLSAAACLCVRIYEGNGVWLYLAAFGAGELLYLPVLCLASARTARASRELKSLCDGVGSAKGLLSDRREFGLFAAGALLCACLSYVCFPILFSRL